MSEFERVRQIDAPAVIAAIVEAGGPRLALAERLSGGAVGAWVVRWSDGHESVLTWRPPLRPDQPKGQLDRAMAMMELAAAAGVPVPAYEAVVGLADGGIAVLQERVAGVVPSEISARLIEHLLELVECRRGVVGDGPPLPMYLRRDGPGYCLHGPLRTWSTETARLLKIIEATVGAGDDFVAGTDVVHFDFHIGNVLVDPARPDRVRAIVDWGGAAPGKVELDLAILAFDLTWRSPGRLQQRVEQHLVTTTDEPLFMKAWAHASLRLLDWTIRHFPHDTDHWASVARRYLPA